MLFISSIDYPAMSIHIYSDNEGFRCHKFRNGKKIKDAFKQCGSKVELEQFLLSLPSAPEKEIRSFIGVLEKLQT